jgi:hypothetical protein
MLEIGRWDAAGQEVEQFGKQFLEATCHHFVHWFAWLQFGVF